MTPRGAPAPHTEEPVYTPRELDTAPSQSLHVGGRLLAAPGGGWQLADAHRAIALEGLAAEPLREGWLVVVRGEWREGSLCDVEVLDTQAPDRSSPELLQGLRSGLGTRLELRARVLAEVRQFFAARGFLEIDTPIWSRECGTETHVEPVRCEDGYLITSPELHMKRLLVTGVFKSFQLVHCFRKGERGALHSPEFLMLEWYRAFSGYESVLADTEQLVEALCRAHTGEPRLKLPDGRVLDMSAPFQRLSVRDAFAQFAGVSDAAELARRDEDQYFQVLVDAVEPAIARAHHPVFLYDYPASQAALARLVPDDPEVAERFELYVGGVELCNGYGELNSVAEQRRRCEADRVRRRELGRHVPELPARFLSALELGMPRAGGNALGLDRLIALLSGAPRIDAVRPLTDDDV